MQSRRHVSLVVSGLLVLVLDGASAGAAAKDGGSKRSGKNLATLTERKDLNDRLGGVLCKAQPDGLPTTFWQAGIYDAQVEGRFVRSASGLAVPTEVLLRKAKTLARVRHFSGYAYGHCKDGAGWAAALPSSSSVQLDSTTLKLPAAELTRDCANWRVDFAPRDRAQTQALDPKPSFSLAPLGHGVLSIVCQPKTPSWAGPVLRFLIPVGQGPASSIPEADALSSDQTPPDQLLSWINRVRKKFALAPLTSNTFLHSKADLLSADSSVSHNRTLLKKISRDLEASKFRFIGENRVKAPTVNAMAWLLWNSPRHRELIMTPEARNAAIAYRSLGSEQLAVVVLSAQDEIRTVKSSPDDPKAM